jgi:hypothetical protein
MKWISVEERLPKTPPDGYAHRYHIYTGGEAGADGWYDKDGWHTLHPYREEVNVTHWMPLPPKPEEG